MDWLCFQSNRAVYGISKMILSFFHYMMCFKRLTSCEESIRMNGGNEECPVDILLQRELILAEKDYYGAESLKLIFLIVIILSISFILYKHYVH